MLGLYDGGILSRLGRTTTEHIARVEIVPADGSPAFDLSCTALDITFSEDWSPYIQISMTAPMPDDQAKLKHLDSHFLTKVNVYCGYGYDQRIDVQRVAGQLYLRTSETDYARGIINLTAASGECLAQDYRGIWARGTAVPRNGINEALRWLIDFATRPDRNDVIISEFPDGYKPELMAGYDFAPGVNYWDAIIDVASRYQAWVYVDENGAWNISDRSINNYTEESEAISSSGTMTGLDKRFDRDDWANCVILEHVWEDASGNRQIIYGRAIAAAGTAHDPAVCGYKVRHVTRETAIAQDVAHASAASILNNLVTRGTNWQMKSLAEYWVRPHRLQNFNFISQNFQDQFVIRSVTFKPLEGSMEITSRTDEDITITTGAP